MKNDRSKFKNDQGFCLKVNSFCLSSTGRAEMSSKRGDSLIEVLIAVLVISFVATTLVGLISRSIHDAQFAKHTVRAAKLADEGIELARTVRDRKGWEDFSVYGDITIDPACDPEIAGRCYTSVDTTNWVMTGEDVYTGEQIDDNVFTRKYIIKHAPTSCESEINVIVSWDEPGGAQKAKSTTKLTDWECP